MVATLTTSGLRNTTNPATSSLTTGFRVAKGAPGTGNPADQGGIVSNTYTLISWPYLAIDTTGGFITGSNLQLDISHSRWTPVPANAASGRWVDLQGQVWVSTGADNSDVNNPTYLVKIIKNCQAFNGAGQQTGAATDVFTGFGAIGSAQGTAAIPFSGTDFASPGDYYQIILFATSTATGVVNVDSNWAHTFFCGTVMP